MPDESEPKPSWLKPELGLSDDWHRKDAEDEADARSDADRAYEAWRKKQPPVPIPKCVVWRDPVTGGRYEIYEPHTIAEWERAIAGLEFGRHYNAPR